MSAGKICVRSVSVARGDETVREIARRMAASHVGTLVVTDGASRVLGVVTDRDLVARCLAGGRDPDATRVVAVMSAPPVVVREETPIEEVLAAMARAGVRRLPVIDGADRLVGIVTMDDVLELLAEEMDRIGRLVRKPRPSVA